MQIYIFKFLKVSFFTLKHCQDSHLSMAPMMKSMKLVILV